jgi:hypothetical protein
VGDLRNVYRSLAEKYEGTIQKTQMGDDIKINLMKTGWVMCSGFRWLRTGKVASFCEHGDEPSV